MAHPSGRFPISHSEPTVPATSPALADAAITAWIAQQANIYIIGFSCGDDFVNSQHVRTVLYTTLDNPYYK